MRQVAERNAALLDINNAIITQLTQNELFRTICQALRRITPYDRAALTLFDGEAQRLRFVALEGEFFSNFFRVGQTLGIDDSHYGWASHASVLNYGATWKRNGKFCPRVSAPHAAASFCPHSLLRIPGKPAPRCLIASLPATVEA